jgi:hypothetical protein
LSNSDEEALQVSWLPSAWPDFIPLPDDDILVSFQGVTVENLGYAKRIRPTPQPSQRKYGPGLRHGHHKYDKRLDKVRYTFGLIAPVFDPTNRNFDMLFNNEKAFDHAEYFTNNPMHPMLTLNPVHIRD